MGEPPVWLTVLMCLVLGAHVILNSLRGDRVATAISVATMVWLVWR